MNTVDFINGMETLSEHFCNGQNWWLPLVFSVLTLKLMIACYHSLCQNGLTCPTCKVVYGVKTGDMPDGTMEVRNAHYSLPGHEGYGCIEITYNFTPGVHVCCNVDSKLASYKFRDIATSAEWAALQSWWISQNLLPTRLPQRTEGIWVVCHLM